MGLKDFKGVEIRSTVVGLNITIPKAHFVKLLELEGQGKVISEYKKDEHYREAIKKNMFIIEEALGKSKSMNDNCRVLFKILISSILPREGGVDTISWEHKHLLYFLLSGHKINLAECLFEHLCGAIKDSTTRELLLLLIPDCCQSYSISASL
ncbi:hypothetical protein A2U01_0041782 [Trifolium medium]|uniref:Uncharacterized protein n=1 Tax=Trifolium medium TaxID=97028 RepID=A0A392QA69_9FABA|nr:hypothetical protein [Trifolium medium]